jgi:hypothetical protein
VANFWNSFREIISLVGTAILSYFTGKSVAEKEGQIKDLEDALEGAKRVQEVPLNTDRDAALERLRKSGHVRD